jgi:Zn-dependent protease with chaperone function
VHVPLPEPYGSLAGLIAILPVFYFGFGWVSRRFERQADVFAARTLTSRLSPPPQPEGVTEGAAPILASATTSAVGFPGASIVSSALHRIAVINNIPIRANEWLHGSIAWRIAFLMRIAEAEQHTDKYDRLMRRIYCSIIGLILLFGTWTAWEAMR